VPAALALGPHEVLVLANARSADSVEIARAFMRQRNVPDINLVRLELPPAAAGSPAQVSPEEFTRYIWEPAGRQMRERGIDAHILAWVYSTDFPVRLKTEPEISIQGITFLRNRLPPQRQVDRGLYGSPLYAGPDGLPGEAHFPQTFDVYREWLGEDMPLPSMMLGITGTRGNTKEEVLQCIRNGAASDGSFPQGTVYFVTNTDVRSTCRQWLFPLARDELRVLDVEAEVTGTFPEGRDDVLGLMIGAAVVEPGKAGRYLPGCMAEHLTSTAGMFHHPDQTKLTAWIRAGATASAGTVSEPFSIWTKFPNGRFYVHYASGCSMIESFFQSVRCPLQLLVVGEPLAAPWASRPEMVLYGLDSDVLSGVERIRADVLAEPPDVYSRYLFLLDGRVAGTERELDLDTTKIEEGEHVLRAVAYRTGLVRNQVFKEVTIRIGRP
jgi:uncharacterized protein (TIGR03790 family)